MEETRKTKNKRHKFIKEVSENEFWVFMGILIAASLFSRGGMNLWPSESDMAQSLFTKADFSKFMSMDRFKILKRFAPSMFHDETRKDSDDWWPIVQLIEDYNANRQETVAASFTKVFDELMSAFRPQSQKNGNLPHLSFILRKPEDLGTEFKNAACAETGINLFIEIQRGKLPMRELEFNNPHRPCSACTLRLTKGSIHCGQRIESSPSESATSPTATGDLFYGDSWFASVESATHTKLKFNSEFVGPVKTAYSRFPRKFLEKTMAEWPGGTWLVLEGKGHEGVDLLAIGYKYNSRKVLSFITTKGAGNTEPGVPYEARWTDNKGNTRCRKIARPDVISRYFVKSNVIDKHNHARQAELKLEKKWVTKDGYFRIFTTVLGMTVIDSWKGYKHHLSYNDADKNLQVLDFAERLAAEMLNKTYSTISPSDRNFNISPLRRQDDGGDDEGGSPRRRTSPRRVIGVNGHSTISSLGMSDASSVKAHIMEEHTLEKRKGKVVDANGYARVKRSKCTSCNKKSTWVCKSCPSMCLCQGDCAQIHVDKMITRERKRVRLF
jgi:hypothetical protein